MSVLDALVLVGGGDVDPALYSASPHPATSGVNRERDDNELALLGAALASGTPVLAICRGLQLLNVHLGQRSPSTFPTWWAMPVINRLRVASVRSRSPSNRVGCCRRPWASRPSSRARTTRPSIVSAEGLVVTARASDGLIEAVELPAAAFVVGVQWHPEQDGDLRVFEALVARGA